MTRAYRARDDLAMVGRLIRVSSSMVYRSFESFWQA